MRLNKNTNAIVLAIFLLGLLLTGLFFGYTVFTSFVKPFFLDKPKEPSGISLSAQLDEAVENVTKRGGLTVSSPSATLTNEAITKPTAEIINASSIVNAARSIADGLEELGITVSKVGNSQDLVSGNVLSLKSKTLLLRDRIIEKMGTDSANIRVETLEETYPFDIRIVIGR